MKMRCYHIISVILLLGGLAIGCEREHNEKETSDYGSNSGKQTDTTETQPVDTVTVPDDRYVFNNYASGYSIAVPSEDMVPDSTLALYGMVFNWPDSKLRVTYERVTPYEQNSRGYGIYTGEWLDRYISNQVYINQNGLSYFTPAIKNDTSVLPGFDVTVYSILAKGLSRPYYRIAIIRKEGQWARFGLLVYKSVNPDDEKFDGILRSWSVFTPRGGARNYLPAQQARENPSWNDETRNYYRKLLNQNTLDFGVFSGSMTTPDKSNYEYNWNVIESEKERLQGSEGIGHDYDIMPTYNHLSWYSEKHYFPSEMAAHFAGGNGFNGKPVLQFTLQYTTNNNNVNPSNTSNCVTPMFDILRGKYDSDFIKLASDVKAYGKPVIFRLNNEMNTDWTSYCGMMTLLDPDIFIDTWRYLYDIFEENGVDNCIWQFNPIAVSCPYSYWGEDLAYYPGNDYVQMLGLTNYEMNNSEWGVESFKSRYTYIYDKSYSVFGNMPWIIGEFACGAGGETSGELGRYQSRQAEWVRGMFKDIKNREPYAVPIKGAVWFSCNDYSGSEITNYLRLDEDLTETLAAFREGFSSLESE